MLCFRNVSLSSPFPSSRVTVKEEAYADRLLSLGNNTFLRDGEGVSFRENENHVLREKNKRINKKYDGSDCEEGRNFPLPFNVLSACLINKST